MKLLKLFVVLMPMIASLVRAEDKPIPRLEVFTNADFSISIPAGWRQMTFGGRYSLYLSGDGIQLPASDNGNPLQAGLSVEKFENIKGSPLDGAKSLAKTASQNPRLSLIKSPVIEEVTLKGGVKAAIVVVEAIKEGQRGSLQIKLLVKNGSDIGYVVSAWLVGAKDSKLARVDSMEAKRLIEIVKTIALSKSENKKA